MEELNYTIHMTTSKGKLLMEDVGAVRSYCPVGFTAKVKSVAVITYICMYKYRISLVRMRPLLHCPSNTRLQMPLDQLN